MNYHPSLLPSSHYQGPALFRTYDAALAVATRIHGPAWHNSVRIEKRFGTGTNANLVYVVVKASPQSQPLL